MANNLSTPTMIVYRQTLDLCIQLNLPGKAVIEQPLSRTMNKYWEDRRVSLIRSCSSCARWHPQKIDALNNKPVSRVRLVRLAAPFQNTTAKVLNTDSKNSPHISPQCRLGQEKC